MAFDPSRSPPETPNKQPSNVIGQIKHTPFNRGSASHVAHDVHFTHDDYATYIEEDLLGQKIVPFEDCLQTILCLKTDRWEAEGSELHRTFKVVVESSKFKKLLLEYCKAVPEESHRYPPFVRLYEAIGNILEFGPNPRKGKTGDFKENAVLCRNDPCFISGSLALRKPDNVIIRQKHFFSGDRLCMDSCQLRGPNQLPGDSFHWASLLSFKEHKMIRNCLLDEQGSPKATDLSQDRKQDDGKYSFLDVLTSAD
jgi:hypothetical protein